MPKKLTLILDQPLPPEIIVRALREATPEQFASERGRRNSAARKTFGAGPGRPKSSTLKVLPVPDF